MKTKLYSLVFLFMILPGAADAAVYYVNAVSGHDNNDGLSQETAFKTLFRIAEIDFVPGDCICLEGGQTFRGTLELKNVYGTKRKPVTICSVGHGRAVIDAAGYPNGILVYECSNIDIHGLAIRADGGGMIRAEDKNAAMRCGIFITAEKPGIYSGIKVSDIEINDIYFEDKGFVRDQNDVNSPNGTGKYGWGIRTISSVKGVSIKDITIEDCSVTNVSHSGIRFTGKYNTSYIENVRVAGNDVHNVGGPGIQFSSVKNGYAAYNVINTSGCTGDSRNWGRGSCLWTWGSSDFIIEHNQFLNADGPADSAGAHIDYYCKNIVLQYNLSRNNGGGFVEILGSNYNCCYRYNVSINDGHRISRVGKAFQEGKTIWLSGYTGKKRQGPYNSYIYNNTIYTKKSIIPKFAMENTAVGVFMANNIFCIEGNAITVPGDQYNPEKAGESVVRNIMFTNNLFLHSRSWPADNIQDKSPLYGDPEFVNKEGQDIASFRPMNSGLIKNGVKIQKLPGDKIGLKIGLKVNKDILGNEISGHPQVGAIYID